MSTTTYTMIHWRDAKLNECVFRDLHNDTEDMQAGVKIWDDIFRPCDPHIQSVVMDDGDEVYREDGKQ